jgi:hypothetical protein
MPGAEYSHLRFLLDSGYNVNVNSPTQLNDNYAAFLQLDNHPLVQRLYPKKKISSDYDSVGAPTGFLFGPTERGTAYGEIDIPFRGSARLDRFYGDITWASTGDFDGDAIGLNVLLPNQAFAAKFGVVASSITNDANQMSMSMNEFSVIAYPPDPLILGDDDAAISVPDAGVIYELWFQYVLSVVRVSFVCVCVCVCVRASVRGREHVGA